MKLTDRFSRRGLLSLIGLGAAAAALVPTPTKAAAAEPLTPCGHIADECCDACWGTGEATMSATRSYANGRADGYNRGREVEAARHEARAEVVDGAITSITLTNYGNGYA